MTTQQNNNKCLFLNFQIRPALPSKKVTVDEEVDVDIDEEEDERVLVINHRENETASPEEDEDSGREDSAWSHKFSEASCH